MRQPTTLETIASRAQDQLQDADDVYVARDALFALGLAHLRMYHLRRSAEELWTYMHGRTGAENLGIFAACVAYIASGVGNDPLTLEQFSAENASTT